MFNAQPAGDQRKGVRRKRERLKQEREREREKGGGGGQTDRERGRGWMEGLSDGRSRLFVRLFLCTKDSVSL